MLKQWWNRLMRPLLLPAAVLLFGCHQPSYQTFPPKQVAQLLHDDSTVVLLDVRTPQEYAGDSGHLAGAMLLPVDDLEKQLPSLEQYKHRTIVAYCRSGHRSAKAAQLLTSRGFDAISMEGGIVAWRKENLPIERGMPTR